MIDQKTYQSYLFFFHILATNNNEKNDTSKQSFVRITVSREINLLVIKSFPVYKRMTI